jgi:hypothetical protein
MLQQICNSRDANSSKKSNNRKQHKRQLEHQGTCKPVVTPLARGTSTSVGKPAIAGKLEIAETRATAGILGTPSATIMTTIVRLTEATEETRTSTTN